MVIVKPKRCPICGKEPTTDYVGPMFDSKIFLQCLRCGIKTKSAVMYWIAVEDWNGDMVECFQPSLFDALF